MAYQLTNLIKNLKPEEIRGFRLQENRYNYKKQDKKLTLLFDAIKKDNSDEYSDELMLKLFPKGNKNAYYRLKNLLVSRIEDSLVYLHRDKNQEFEVYKYLHLHQVFFHKSAYTEACNYLEKAEKIALKLEDYDLLILICRKFIRLSEFLEKSPEEYIERQSKYQKLAATTNKTEYLISMLNFRLKRTNFSGKDNEVLDILEQVSASLQLNELTTQSVRTKLLVNRCIRDILLQKKEFFALSEYMISSYRDFKKEQIFGKNNHEEKIIQLSWIVNSLTKIKNFKDAPQYIDELHEQLLMYNSLYYDKYIWLYYQSRVIEYAYSKKYHEAITLLQQLENKDSIQHNSGLEFYVHLNMTILYFGIGKLNNSLKYLSKILLNSAFNNMSSDWKLNIQLLELIVRTDNDDIEYAISKTNEIKRKYRESLKREEYQIEKRFIKITTAILKKPAVFKDEKFIKEVNQFIEDAPDYEPGSNELINYSIWLQSKMQKKEYYSLIPNVF